MSTASTECVYRGRAAAPGLAMGPLVPVARRLDLGAASSSAAPAAERERLHEALAAAREALAGLARDAGAEAAAILEFQMEMAEDEELVTEISAAIDAGEPALDAWWSALEALVADYQGTDDEYFRARAADLGDLRDRVAIALGARADEGGRLPDNAIVLDDDFTPSRFLALIQGPVAGFVAVRGSASSHVAMLARARGVPMITGLEACPDPAEQAILDAGAGTLVTHPAAETAGAYQRRLRDWRREEVRSRAAMARPAVTGDGRRITVLVNVDHPDAVGDEVLAAADGVGLMRTELLFLQDPGQPPDEEAQYHAYRGLLRRLDGKPCTIRTLDVGGDKPVAGISAAGESNPFLGLRGIRLTLEKPAVFRPQIRALLRAAASGPLKVMLPMVALPAEHEEALALFRAELAALREAGTPAALPEIGIMVETPAAALAIDTFDAAFYSIGSNDLIQYVMAAARDGGGRLAALQDPRAPAVLRLIRGVVEHGRRTGRPVSLCGDMASDPDLVKALIDAGLECLSVAPAAVGRVKLALARCQRDARAGHGA